MLASLENSPFAVWVRSDSLWGLPFALVVHSLGTALVIGFVLIITLRLLGLFETIPYASLNRMFPIVWIAIVLQLASGFVLWATKPTQYVIDIAFLVKLLALIAGIVLTVYTFGTIRTEAASWDARGTASMRGLQFTTATLLAWCLVLVTGRLTAFLGAV